MLPSYLFLLVLATMPTHVILYPAFAVLLPVSVIPPCFTIIAPYSLGLNLIASSLTSTWFAKGQAKLASSSCPNDHNPPSVSLYMRAIKGDEMVKENHKFPGVYCLVDNINGKCYKAQ